MEKAGQTMPNWLMQRAALTPERPAVMSGSKSYTFRELDERARRTAARLLQIGVQAGDHVALLVQNGLHTVELIHALHYIGAVLVPLNTRLSTREWVWQVRDSEASVLIYDGTHQTRVEALATVDLPAKAYHWEELVSVDADETVASQLQQTLSLDALQGIMYTSGTTGHPKGVMLTYGNHWWSAVGSMLNLGLHTQDRWLVCVPLYHMSGLSILMRSVIYGITAVIHESFDPEAANRAIVDERITHVSVVSAMLARMVERLGPCTYPASLRCMLLGGGPVPQILLEKCLEKKIPVFQTYGLTETASQIVTLAPEYMEEKSGSAGKPLFPAELRIVKDGKALPPGEAGEILVKGPNVSRGYWRRESATARAIQDGWLYTGDIGYVDGDGFLYVLDRRSDLIISGGENVYPAEIEAVLISHPAVKDAGVTGMPDEEWGSVPAAFITLRQGAHLQQGALRRFCEKRLARYKVPRRFYVIDQLPRNGANKLLRRKLAQLIPGATML